MTPPRFTDEELLALIEGELPADRAMQLRNAVRDGDLELAGRLVDMAEHRDFLREMRIDRSDLNPSSATTPEGIVSAAIAAAEREQLVPAPVEFGGSKRPKWLVPLAACAGIAAMIAVGVVISGNGGTGEGRLPDDIEEQIASGRAAVVGTEEEGDSPLEQKRRNEEALRELARELVDGESRPEFDWPGLERGPEPGIEDPITADPIEIAGGSGLREVMSDDELASMFQTLEEAGARTSSGPNPVTFAGTDPLGLEREFTLEEAAALAKAGRLAISLEGATGVGVQGGYLADAQHRYAIFETASGAGGPETIDLLRASERVTGLTQRVGDVLGSVPSVLASYRFDASGARSSATQIERATMLELIAAVVSPANTGPDGSRLRLIELPFDASDEPSVGTGEGEDPFWWLEPEAEYGQRGTALIPVVVK
jgi:hypothetical protein